MKYIRKILTPYWGMAMVAMLMAASFCFGMPGFISTRVSFCAAVFLFTLGENLEAISVMPFIMNHTPSSHRGRMSSILPIIMGTGFVLGPVISGELLDRSCFQTTWMIIGTSALVMTLVMKVLDLADSRFTEPLRDRN